MITQTLSALPNVTAEERAQILSAERTEDAHRALLGAVPAMNAVQTGGTASRTVLPATLSVAAWNVERCLFPPETAAHLAGIAPDIVLLSEVDHGMARTGQRHTTEEVADALGMAYAFGVEFFELDLGGATERQFCKDDFNALGWHGNAVLSSVPFEKVALVRLDDHGHWFAAHSDTVDPNQPRLGGRMAIVAICPTEAGPVCVVSTHLESNSGADHREVQFDRLMDAIDALAPGLPVLIGGDLNTGNHLPPDYDWRREGLFKAAEARGYDWRLTADGTTTRASLISPHPSRQMKLDWLAGRNVACMDKGVLSSISSEGKPLSDHDCVWCRIEVNSA